MARLAVFSVAVIFLLFCSGHAHARFITADQDVTSGESVAELPESNPKTTNNIQLPEQVIESQPVDSKPDDAVEAKSDVDSVPMLTMIRLRPINSHFPWRPFIPFRHNHGCRFRFNRKFRPSFPRPIMQNINIPYGNDMILSNDRNRFDPESRGVVRPIHARWVAFPHDTDRFKKLADLMKLHHHDHEHGRDHDHDEDHHHHHHHRHHHHGEEEEHEHEGGFMKKLRKFLFINF